MPSKALAPGLVKSVKTRIPYKEREYFIENLSLLLKAGVPVGQAVASMGESARSRQTKRAMEQMAADINGGSSLAQALEHSGVVSGQTLALVRLGEQSGHLVENMQLAAEQEEKRHIMHAKIRSALIYPSFVLGLTAVVGLGVAWFLLPRLAATFSQLQVDLPFISKWMMQSGIFLKEHGFVAVPSALFAVGCIGYVLFFAPKTKVMGQRILFHFPGISRLMREVEVSQFGYLLGTLLEAGLPVTKAIDLLADSSSVIYYKRFYGYLAQSLQDGRSFQETLKGYKNISQLLPPAVQQMVIAGERSGSLPEILRTVGRTYEQKSDITTQNLEAILEPVLLLIVWVGVMAVAVAVIVPIYSLVGGVGK